MAFVSLSVDPLRVKALQDDLAGIPGAANKALADSLNEAGREGVKSIKASFLENLALNESIAKKTVDRRVTLRGGKATPDNLAVKITIGGKPISLISFKNSYSRRDGDGVNVEIFRGRVIRYANAFIGIGPRGAKHIMEATGPRVTFTQVHYRRNLGRTTEDPRTIKGTNFIDVIAQKPDVLQKPLERVYEVFASSTAKNLDKFLKRQK